MVQVLQRDPDQRPSAQEALEHPWLGRQYTDGEQAELGQEVPGVTAVCSFSYQQAAKPAAFNIMGFECMSFEY